MQNIRSIFGYNEDICIHVCVGEENEGVLGCVGVCVCDYVRVWSVCE